MTLGAVPIKVAIIGTGLAGLSAAHFLTQAAEDGGHEIEVHLFEKAHKIGMDSSSISLPDDANGNRWRVNVPMRSFQGGYYPQLIQLYKSLDIVMRQADFSYSFSIMEATRKIKTPMIYNGSSGRRGISIPSMYTSGSETDWSAYLIDRVHFTVTMFYMALCFIRLLLFSIPALRDSNSEKMTFREWCSYSTPTGWFPRLCGVCTAPEDDVFEYPVQEFLDYTWLTFATHHYMVANGVQEVVSKLERSVKPEHVHLATPITGLLPSITVSQGVDIRSPDAEFTGFHHVIFATSPRVAASVIESYSATLPRDSSAARKFSELTVCLQTWKFCPAIVINHTDTSLLPSSPDDHRDLNLVRASTQVACGGKRNSTPEEHCVSRAHVMVTHVIQPPPAYSAKFSQIYQTTNPFISPDESTILSIAKLERALLTIDSQKALQRLCVLDDALIRRTSFWGTCRAEGPFTLGDLQGRGSVDGAGIWICGSFASPGIPLLEGCVVSARNVVYQGIMPLLS